LFSLDRNGNQKGGFAMQPGKENRKFASEVVVPDDGLI
jgi:hypothetical protein